MQLVLYSFLIHSLVEGLESTRAYDYTKYHPMDEVRFHLLYRCFYRSWTFFDFIVDMLIRDCTHIVSDLSLL